MIAQSIQVPGALIISVRWWPSGAVDLLIFSSGRFGSFLSKQALSKKSKFPLKKRLIFKQNAKTKKKKIGKFRAELAD